MALKYSAIHDDLSSTPQDVSAGLGDQLPAPTVLTPAALESVAGPVNPIELQDAGSLSTAMNQFSDDTRCGISQVVLDSAEFCGPSSSPQVATDTAPEQEVIEPKDPLLCFENQLAYELCTSLFNAMSNNVDSMPLSIKMMMKLIFELTTRSRGFNRTCKIHSHGNESSPEPHVFAELTCSDEKSFCQSCCGILFLRMICPALVCPMEWGALRRRPAAEHKRPPSTPQSSSGKQLLEKQSQEAGSGVGLLESVRGILGHIHRYKYRNSAGDAETNREGEDQLVSDDLSPVSAWIDKGDDVDRGAEVPIDVSKSSATLIMIAHVLVSAPALLERLDNRVAQSHLTDTPITSDDPEAADQSGITASGITTTDEPVISELIKRIDSKDTDSSQLYAASIIGHLNKLKQFLPHSVVDKAASYSEYLGFLSDNNSAKGKNSVLSEEDAFVLNNLERSNGIAGAVIAVAKLIPFSMVQNQTEYAY